MAEMHRPPDQVQVNNLEVREESRSRVGGAGDERDECDACGLRHARTMKCPAETRNCRRCNKMGHFERKCRSKRWKRARTSTRKAGKRSPSADTERKERKYRLNQIVAQDDKPKPFNFDDVCLYTLKKQVKAIHAELVYKYISLQNSLVYMLVDGGSPVNIIDEIEYNKLNVKPELEDVKRKIYGYGTKTPIETLGSFKTTVICGSTRAEAEFIVAKGNYGCLIGISTACDLGLQRKITSDVMINGIKEDLKEEYPKLFDSKIGKLKDYEVNLHVDTNVRPVCQPFRQMPYHQRAAVEAELDRMIENDIIEPAIGPTTWCSAMVVVPKEDGTVRICSDGRPLKCALQRERHPSVTLSDLKYKINGAKFFSKIDMRAGYYQLKLAKTSRVYTTFSTHLGLFWYKRLNMGISCSSEIFQREIHKILFGIPGQVNISDDILIFAKSREEHDAILHTVLKRLQIHGLTVNQNKCEFNKSELIFFGMRFSEEGISPDPAKIDAIKEAPAPKNADELRSFLGLASYVQSFVPNFATITSQLWDLTKKKNEWVWNENHERVFKKLKDSLTKEARAYYKPKWSTTLVVDASSVGIGGIVAQTDPKDSSKRHIVDCASRLLSDTEKKYSQIEKEALAVVWACERFHLYLYGCEFNIVTDNKAVELIYKNPESKPPIRLQRWALRLTPYKYSITHAPGKTNIADYISRHPVNPPEEDNVEVIVNLITDASLIPTITKEEIIEETKKDKLLQIIKEEIEKNGLFKNEQIKEYKHLKNHLTTTSDGLVMMNQRMAIPESLQERVLSIAHQGHQGITRTQRALKCRVWFKNMNKKVEDLVKRCTQCQVTTGYEKYKPVKSTEMPEGPWHELATDLYGPLSENGNYLFVVTDQYSRYPLVNEVKRTDAKTICNVLKEMFSTFGIPNLIKSDNGPPYNSAEFEAFSKYMGFKHQRTTPYHHRSNGQVEAFMKNLTKMRRIAKIDNKSYKEKIIEFLAAYRSTPHSSTGKTPIELLFNHNRETIRLPPTREQFKTKQMQEAEQMDEVMKKKMKEYKDNIGTTNKLKLEIGDLVRVRNQIQRKDRKTHV